MINLGLHWVFAALHGLSLVAVRGLLFCVVSDLLVAVVLLLWSTGPRRAGLSSCGVWVLETGLQ